MAKSWPTLYVKTAAGSINFWQIWTEGPSVCTRWGQLGTDNPLEDRYQAVGKNIGRKNETSPEEQAVKEAQAKYEKQLRLKYVHSADDARTNLNIKPMRAYSLDAKREKKLKFPVTIQPKFNGVRCMAYNLPDGTVRLMSRGGKDYSVAHVQAELATRLPEGWILDGELYAHGVSLQNIRSYIETPQIKTLMVMYHVYDLTSMEPGAATWRMRFATLRNWFDANPGLEHVELSPWAEAHSMDEVRAFHTDCVNQGFEGCMIRVMTGVYRMAAKSVNLLKVKDHMDDEFTVVGWSVGKDGVLLYRCVQEQGFEFEVRPMGNERERAELLATADQDVGKLLTVRFQERSDDNIPIHGRGVAFRPKKDLD